MPPCTRKRPISRDLESVSKRGRVRKRLLLELPVSLMLQRCHFTSYDEFIHAILSCVAVVKPTPVPTKAPTPPPPATVPPALDGKDSFNQCIYFVQARSASNVALPASQCAKVPRPTWFSWSMVPGVLETTASIKSSSLLQAWLQPSMSSALKACRSADISVAS